MAEEPQYHNIHGKPLFDILSKLPSKSLLRFRCVSKLWREYIDDSYFVSIHDKQVIEDPTPILLYFTRNFPERNLCFHTIETHITNLVLKAKSNPVFEFVGKKFFVFGSCNGLVLIKTYDSKADDRISTFTVIHPISKQCYVLPKLPLLCTRHSCGLGFDSSTKTFKMVCLLYLSPNYPYDLRTMVHVFGTNSWREIPKVPSYDISGEAIFAHGCLHWLAQYNFLEYGPRQVIWFDVTNEEFGFIKPPKTISKPSKRQFSNHFSDYLVNLDGQVGYFINKTKEIWVLNHKKEWLLHSNFEDLDFPDYHIQVLGCLNKAGDILIKLTNAGRGKEEFYIYNLKNRVIHKTRIDGLNLRADCFMDMVMFPNSLLDIITNSNLFKNIVIHEASINGLPLEDESRTDVVMFPNSLLDIITNFNLFRSRACRILGAFLAEISRVLSP